MIILPPGSPGTYGNPAYSPSVVFAQIMRELGRGIEKLDEDSLLWRPEWYWRRRRLAVAQSSSPQTAGTSTSASTILDEIARARAALLPWVRRNGLRPIANWISDDKVPQAAWDLWSSLGPRQRALALVVPDQARVPYTRSGPPPLTPGGIAFLDLSPKQQAQFRDALRSACVVQGAQVPMTQQALEAVLDDRNLSHLKLTIVAQRSETFMFYDALGNGFGFSKVPDLALWRQNVEPRNVARLEATRNWQIRFLFGLATGPILTAAAGTTVVLFTANGREVRDHPEELRSRMAQALGNGGGSPNVNHP